MSGIALPALPREWATAVEEYVEEYFKRRGV
jgi:hypothetical protein